jgi:hypothetical protein
MFQQTLSHSSIFNWIYFSIYSNYWLTYLLSSLKKENTWYEFRFIFPPLLIYTVCIIKDVNINIKELNERFFSLFFCSIQISYISIFIWKCFRWMCFQFNFIFLFLHLFPFSSLFLPTKVSHLNTFESIVQVVLINVLILNMHVLNGWIFMYFLDEMKDWTKIQLSLFLLYHLYLLDSDIWKKITYWTRVWWINLYKKQRLRWNEIKFKLNKIEIPNWWIRARHLYIYNDETAIYKDITSTGFHLLREGLAEKKKWWNNEMLLSFWHFWELLIIISYEFSLV